MLGIEADVSQVSANSNTAYEESVGQEKVVQQ